jgi:hypothetical protein
MRSKKTTVQYQVELRIEALLLAEFASLVRIVRL